jgi:hypothetical protein
MVESSEDVLKEVFNSEAMSDDMFNYLEQNKFKKPKKDLNPQ